VHENLIQRKYFSTVRLIHKYIHRSLMHLEFTITTIIIVTDKCDSQFISHDVSHNSTELRNRYFKFF
jgi:hypothetical protein